MNSTWIVDKASIDYNPTFQLIVVSNNVKIIGNPSESKSHMSKDKKVKHHIRMKTHKSIVLRFWIRGGVNPLCEGWVNVSLVLYLPSDPPLKDPTKTYPKTF